MIADPTLEVLDDAEAVAHRAAAVIAQRLRESVASRGRATLALSGGRSPRRMLELLSNEPLPWGCIDVLQVDERLAPDGHPDRNKSGTQKAMARIWALHPKRFHWMPVTTADLVAAGRRYAATLAALTDSTGTIDLVHLGLGEDGHTASLFPGDLPADDAADVTVTAEHAGRRRMTLTFTAINRARLIVWVVTGVGKRAALERLLNADPGIPAAAVRRSGALILADQAAADAPSV